MWTQQGVARVESANNNFSRTADRLNLYSCSQDDYVALDLNGHKAFSKGGNIT